MKLLLQNISFGYKRQNPVLQNVSPELFPGGITALLGSNGSGKSTLLKVISGMYPPDSGRAEIDGVPTASLPPRVRAAKIGVISQLPANPGSYSAAEAVAMGAYHRTSGRAALPRDEVKLLEEVLFFTGIGDLRSRPCNELSGGELQLVMAARSFMQLPGDGVLLADEPASMLDPAKKKRFAEILRFRASSRTATLVTTHDPAFAARCADRVILLKNGSVIASGPPAETLSRENLFAAYGCKAEMLAAEDGTSIPFFF